MGPLALWRGFASPRPLCRDSLEALARCSVGGGAARCPGTTRPLAAASAYRRRLSASLLAAVRGRSAIFRRRTPVRGADFTYDFMSPPFAGRLRRRCRVPARLLILTRGLFMHIRWSARRHVAVCRRFGAMARRSRVDSPRLPLTRDSKPLGMGHTGGAGHTARHQSFAAAMTPVSWLFGRLTSLSRRLPTLVYCGRCVIASQDSRAPEADAGFASRFLSATTGCVSFRRDGSAGGQGACLFSDALDAQPRLQHVAAGGAHATNSYTRRRRPAGDLRRRRHCCGAISCRRRRASHGAVYRAPAEMPAALTFASSSARKPMPTRHISHAASPLGHAAHSPPCLFASHLPASHEYRFCRSPASFRRFYAAVSP